MALPQNQSRTQNSGQSYEYQQPPRPYSWKTDEFPAATAETFAKKTQQINQVQPLAPTRPQPQPPNQRFVQPASPVFQQPAPMANFSGYRCPHCGTQNFPHVTRKISTAGWIVFAVLLVMFFPLFWIGFLMKEDVRVCPVCNTRVG